MSLEAVQGSAMERQIVQRLTTRVGELQLAAVETGAETHYELIMNGVFLMATYNAPSCRVLIDVVMEEARDRKRINLLIGGLGMGFALRQALTYPNVASVCVVELEPRIVNWNRKYLGNTDILDDARTEVVVGDFSDYVRGNPCSYNGVAMDIDNGPDWIVRPENRRAYSLSMLQTLSTRLRPGGVLAIWGHALSKPYERALEDIFGNVTLRTACDYDLTGKPLESVIYAVQT